MNQKLLALYGLKWNPFSPELPTEAIYVALRISRNVTGAFAKA